MYVDAVVIPVQKSRRKAYEKLARMSGRIWREHGALRYTEAIADDAKPGKRTSFPRSVKLRKNETVWHCTILYRNRRHRDRVLKKVMADKRLAAMMNPKTIPFDGRRMFWGGFDVRIDL